MGKTPTTLLPLWIRRIVNDDNPLTLKTIDSKSLLIQTMLLPAHAPPVKTNSLVDSGCSARGFADRKFCKDNNIPTLLLPKPRLVLLAYGKAASKITDYFVTKIAVGNHTETCVFFVTTLTADNPIILGLPWLQRHNPTIDWRSMSITFQSPYCLRHCCTAPCTATTVPCPTREPHDVIIPGEPRLQQYQATVEDEPPEERKPDPAVPSQGIELVINQTLTPGRDHYITRRTAAGQGPETRAKMIPNRGTPKPITKTAGSRHATRTPAKLPPLSAPIPRQPGPKDQTTQAERPDMTDIRTTTAASFLQFCKSPGTQCMRMTWDELDASTPRAQPKRLQLPDLPEEEFRRILTGHSAWEDTVTGVLRAWSSGAGPMQFIKKLKKKEEATELGLRGGP